MERESAKKIFGMLPEDQAKEFNDLWEEFEECETIEAQYGAMLDRMQPLLQNYINQGGSWTEHNITVEQIYKRNEKMEETSTEIWDYMKAVIEEQILKGNIRPE